MLVPAGPFVLGVDAASEPYSLDNERPAHVVDLPAFRIGRVPVTNGEWRHFIDDGGYDRVALVVRARLAAPSGRGPDRAAILDFRRPRAPGSATSKTFRADEPVQHVTYFEAEAYAAWAGARLPTEAEWEKACAWDPATGTRRRYPWGAEAPSEARANLGGTALRPAPVGAYPARRFGLRGRADAGRCLGVDQLTAAALARVRPDDLRAVLAAVLRRRLPGAAGRIVGRGVGHPAAQLPQLGPPVPPADFLRRPVGWGPRRWDA